MEAKQLKDTMSRFGNAMGSLKSNSFRQTSILDKMLDMQIEERVRRERQEELDRVKPDENDTPDAPPPSSRGKDNGGTAWNLNPMAILGGGRAVLAALTSAVLILSPMVAETVKSLVKVGLDYIGFDGEFARSLANALGSSVSWGAFGMLLGKKIGLMFAAGSALWNMLDENLDLSSKINELLGTEINPALIDIGGVFASVALVSIGTRLARRALGKAITMVFTDGLATSVAESVKGSVTTAGRSMMRAAIGGVTRIMPAGIAITIAGLYAAYGDDAAEWLSQQTGIDQNWTDMAVTSTSFAAAGASLGLMFGPGGSLVGGIAGLIAGLGYSVWKWFKKNEEEAYKKAEEVAKDVDNQLKISSSGQVNAEGLVNGITAVAEENNMTGYRDRTNLEKTVGRNMAAYDIIAPISDITSTDVDEQGRRVRAMRVALEKLMSEYDGSEQMRDQIYASMNAIKVMADAANKIRDEHGFNAPKYLNAEVGRFINTEGAALWRFATRNFEEDMKGRFDDMKRPKFSKGTRGFADFGVETPALLHGVEAVVPDGTDAASVLKKFFKEDWSFKENVVGQPTIERGNQRADFMNDAARQNDRQNVVIAPTHNSPVVTVVGGTSSTQTNISGGNGSRDLDYGLPRGVL